MRRGALALVTCAACSAPAASKLPGASITPHLLARVTSMACGDDVAIDGHARPDIRYAYTYDALGRLAHATGAYASGPADAIDYAWDNLDHLTHSVETRGWGDTYVETTADYDTLGDLVDYTWTETAARYHQGNRYTYSELTDAGLPGREVIAQPGQSDVVYRLDYDVSNRIAHVIQEGGPITTYSYDDADTRTTTIDTDAGAFHGVIEYDDQDRELSESWDGTDPSAIASDTRYEWSGDRLLSVTYRSATSDAPHDARIIEVDTLRYDCR